MIDALWFLPPQCRPCPDQLGCDIALEHALRAAERLILEGMTIQAVKDYVGTGS
jgi:hypothetical protein